MTISGAPPERSSFLEELEATFLEELDERLRSMEAALVGIERPPDPASLRSALEAFGRDAHSLKGGAQLVGREGLARIAHALETRLERLRAVAPGEPLDVQPLFEAVEALERLRRSGESAGVDVVGIVARLDEPHAGPDAGRTDPAVSASGGSPGAMTRATAVAPPAVSGAASARARVASREGGRVPAARRPRTVRVVPERLDAMMNRTTDLIAVSQSAARRADALRSLVSRFDDLNGAEIATDLRILAREARSDSQRLAAVSEALEADLLGLRMVPLASLFREFPRMVRDLARATGKEVRLENLGWETPMDRELVERLRDPVMHLLRNAVDHGIEAPAQRLVSGKPSMGTIILEARPRAGGITIEVRDDGAGIDVGRVHARAGEAGLVSNDQTEAIRPLALIFEPGLSTADVVTEVSGRGIGLDAVRAGVAALGGTVEVTSEAGFGTRFSLRLPLTLVSTRLLGVRAWPGRYGVPLSAVERAARLEAGALTTLGGRSSLDVPGGPVVLAELATIMGLPQRSIDPTTSRPGAAKTALILSTASGRAGIVVDSVESEREVVLKNFGTTIETPPLLAGAALIEADALLVVIDADAVVEQVISSSPARVPLPDRDRVDAHPARSREAHRPLRVLVVDDSITSRTLEKSILAAAGLDVTLAVDGQDALRAIRATRPDVVVSDVDMPLLDGIGLTTQLRASEATRDLPVILVTSLDAPEQRDRGLLAGADAYLTKQAFDQEELLQTIRELVG